MNHSLSRLFFPFSPDPSTEWKPQCRRIFPVVVAWEELFPCKQLLSPGIAVVVFCPGVKLQGFAASLSGSDLNLEDTRDPAESVPVREHGGDIWEPGHVPQICTIPGLTVGRATSLVMPEFSILCCKSKGNGFSVPFWAGEQWRASFGNAVTGSLFQRLEFLLSCCETLGSQEHEESV